MIAPALTNFIIDRTSATARAGTERDTNFQGFIFKTDSTCVTARALPEMDHPQQTNFDRGSQSIARSKVSLL